MSTDTTHLDQLPIACDPNAVPPDQQEYWLKELVPKLYGSVEEIKELPNGWAWRLPSTPEILVLLAEDLNMERLCCPFVHYTLELERNGGPFWLSWTGGEGVKEYLWMAFAEANVFDEQVARAAGFNVATSKNLDSVQTVIEVIDSVNQRYTKEAASNDR